MSADDKTETSSRLDDDVRDMVFEAKRKIERAMETLPQKRST
jgi:hypothetical protein